MNPICVGESSSESARHLNPPPSEIDVELGTLNSRRTSRDSEQSTTRRSSFASDQSRTSLASNRSSTRASEDKFDPFDIDRTKDAPVDLLRRWRANTLVLNACRRFRYTLDLKKQEELCEKRRYIKSHSAVGQAELTERTPPSTSSTDFPISPKQLASISRDPASLLQYGGVAGLSSVLESSPMKGISGDDADLLRRRNAFGSNNFPRNNCRNILMFMWDACKDPTLVILMVLAVALLALGLSSEGIKEGWYHGGSIVFAVVLVVVVTACNDYKQSLQFQHINTEKRNKETEVIRSGRRFKISIYDLVVGDVIPLNTGNQIHADGILISGLSITLDESSMTGESKIVHKDSKDPFMMSGCIVIDGNGSMLVTAVGLNTEWGLLMASLSDDTSDETPIQVRLNGVATFITIAGLCTAAFIMAFLLLRYFLGQQRTPDGTMKFILGHTEVVKAVCGAIEIIIFGVAIVVSAVPEGLPLAVTLTLAYSARKMMADKALVRRLSACETMGSATVICCSKSGILTTNKMTVVEVYAGCRKIDPPHRLERSPKLHTLLIEGVAQNTNGSVYVPEAGSEVEIFGSPLEKAIFDWGIKLGMNFASTQTESSVLHFVPFNSERKKGGVAVKATGSDLHIHWKGAAEIVLSCCTSYITAYDQVETLEEKKKVIFKKAIDHMTSKGLCCVAFAYRVYEMDRVPDNEEQLANWSLPSDELILLAIVGIKDPCRPGVKDSVQLCHKAGVKVMIITEDNVSTAKAIAVECGILHSLSDANERSAIEGKVFSALSDSEREDIAESILVMGMSSDNDKLNLVQSLRRKGHVVATTGCRLNDIPILHEADIGLAMGIAGTHVARENSDVIVTDDNFASIVKVIKWGRSVYANIQKFIQFQLTVIVVTFVIILSTVFSGNVPLNAVQLLWVNLIVNTLGALALVTEPPTDHLMDRFPVGRREPLITNIMWRNLLIQAMYQVSVCLVINFNSISILGLEHQPREYAIKVKNTLIFNAFVMCLIANAFNSREVDKINIFKGVTRNYLFMGIVVLTVVLQVIVIEFLGKFASSTRLNWNQWLISITVGFFCCPVAALGKMVPVPEYTDNSIFNEFQGEGI